MYSKNNPERTALIIATVTFPILSGLLGGGPWAGSAARWWCSAPPPSLRFRVLCHLPRCRRNRSNAHRSVLETRVEVLVVALSPALLEVLLLQCLCAPSLFSRSWAPFLSSVSSGKKKNRMSAPFFRPAPRCSSRRGSKHFLKARIKCEKYWFPIFTNSAIHLQILRISRIWISRYFCQANFNIIFAILINILQYIDQYIGQSGVNISAILEYIDNILINISNNIGKYWQRL